MALLPDINQAVRSILSTGRIGQPVFVRCVIHQALGNREPTILLVRLAETVCNWLGQECDRVFANGQPNSGPISLVLKCRQGASALLFWADGKTDETRLDLMILGNHGATYLEDFAGHWDDLSGVTADDAGLTPQQKRFVDAIRRSLPSGQPVPLL